MNEGQHLADQLRCPSPILESLGPVSGSYTSVFYQFGPWRHLCWLQWLVPSTHVLGEPLAGGSPGHLEAEQADGGSTVYLLFLLPLPMHVLPFP